MIHLMELPNPDPLTGRPEHGGRDRHTCIAIRDVSKLKMILDKAGKFSLLHLKYNLSLSTSLFFAGITISIALMHLIYFVGIPYTLSKSGRPAIFTRDPDANALEFTQLDG